MHIPMAVRVRLIEKPDVDTYLRAGDDGEAKGYDPDNDLLQVVWDSGSRLPVPPTLVSFMSPTCTSAAMN